MTAWIDGLLEGHESPGLRIGYRVAMGLYIVFTLFGGLCNLPLIMHDGYHASYFIQGLCILGLLAFSLFLVRSYRNDNMDPKFRRATAVLLGIVVMLDIGAIIVFDTVLNYKAEVAPAAPTPTPHPETPGPTPAPIPGQTPSPATPNLTKVAMNKYRAEVLKEQRVARKREMQVISQMRQRKAVDRAVEHVREMEDRGN